MSFGFGVSDILVVIGLVRTVIDTVRRGPREFSDFAHDLQVVQTLFEALQAHRDQFIASTSGLTEVQRQVIEQTFHGMHAGLNELQQQLTHHQNRGASNRGLANFRFMMDSLNRLRNRLEFHMGSLNLLYQQLILARGTQAQERSDEILRMIQQAQEAQVEDDLAESEHGFRQRYLPNQPQSSIGRSTSTSQDGARSRDSLIERWRRNVSRSAARGELSVYSEGSTTYVASGGGTEAAELPVGPGHGNGLDHESDSSLKVVSAVILGPCVASLTVIVLVSLKHGSG